MRPPSKPLRIASQIRHWKTRRQKESNVVRGLFRWSQALLWDLQQTAHQSLNGASFVLEWLYDGIAANAAWSPMLEPLLEQLRRNPDVLREHRTRLINTLLLAGIFGAQIRWLETKCYLSVLAKSVFEEEPYTFQLWRVYYSKAQRADELIWFPSSLFT